MSSTVNIRSSYKSRARWGNGYRPPGTPFEATEAAECRGCDRPILMGQMIYSKGEGRYLHDKCRESQS